MATSRGAMERSLVERALLMRDVIDGQLESSDRLRIGRVADVLIEDGDAGDGPHVTAIAMGPEALAGRVHRGLRGVFHRLLRGRWDQALAIDELEELGPTLRLRRAAHEYEVASGERWVGGRIVRRLPGAGDWPPPHLAAADRDRTSATDPGPTDRGSADLRGADLIGARVTGPAGEHLGEVLDVELRPKDDFAIDSLIVAKEPALARLVLLRQVGPRADREHVLVPWSLVGSIDDRVIRLAKMPPSEAAAARQARAEEREGEAAGASPASAVGERARTEAPGEEGATEPPRRERRTRQ
jgi:sporulation protein YlmC with PRC-barrel domain